MGCGSSTIEFVVKPDVPGQDQCAQEMFTVLQLTQLQINKLYTKFCWIDEGIRRKFVAICGLLIIVVYSPLLFFFPRIELIVSFLSFHDMITKVELDL